LAYDQTLAERIRECLARRRNIAERKMFGCIAFLSRGHAFGGVWKDSLIVRVGRDQYAAALREPDVREFDITGRPMTGWVVVGPEGIADDADLLEWIDRGLKFVATLPAK
jgi:hypothetical protein